VRTAAVSFLAAALASGVLTPLVRDLAHRWGALDHALSSRKIHGRPIPRLGGVAIVLGYYAPLVAMLFANSETGRRFWADPLRASALIVGGLAIALLGMWDDVRGCNARQKFLIQFAIAAAMYLVGFRIDVLANPLGPPLSLGWFGFPFTLLWIAGVINAVNLIDGLDGLAGGVALIAIGTTFVISVVNGDTLMTLFTATLGGAVLGFLFYNFNPASIFMGDTGSMFLGFVLATTSIATHHKSSTAVAVIVPIIALGVPIADTLLAMVRRAVRGVPMFSADRGHIHHRLLASGLTHRQAVFVLYGASAVLGAAAVVLSLSSRSQAAWLLLALSGASYLALRRLGFLSLYKLQQVLEDRRKNLDFRRELRRIGDALRESRRIEELWASLRIAARALDASAFALHLHSNASGEPEIYSEGFDEAGPELFRARYGLVPERQGDTQLELGWSDGRNAIDRDTEIAIELLCDHLSSAIDRIEPVSQEWLDEQAAEGKVVVNLRRG
jgi:UDP-GlcNAc:undecaprenyl-phosphate GlcNAc-1-phosphate transferase